MSRSRDERDRECSRAVGTKVCLFILLNKTAECWPGGAGGGRGLSCVDVDHAISRGSIDL